MRTLITVLCLLCFAGCAYAEAYQVSTKETVTEAKQTVQQDNSKEVKGKRGNNVGNPGVNQSNTYWNFGKPAFFTGTI
mgnify:CR=1 FL=1